MVESITFRYLTPIFRYSHLTDFEHSGEYKEARYTIALKGYNSRRIPEIEEGNILNELLKYGNEPAIKNLQSLHISRQIFPNIADAFLVVDVMQPLTDDRVLDANSWEAIDIFNQFITALRLHTTQGLLYEYTYIFCSHPYPEPSPDNRPAFIQELARETVNYTVQASGINPFGTLRHGVSSLPDEEHEPCRVTFQHLLNKQWDETDTFDKVLKLALEYHRLSFTLERFDHAFLILMVVFEALFKHEKEKNANDAANRIAGLLATIQSDFEPVKDAFYNRSGTAFSGIKNCIAHGDPTLDKTQVEDHTQNCIDI